PLLYPAQNGSGNTTTVLVQDNLAVTPTDFNPYCVTAPSDSRLPGGGGQQICNLYDVTPAKFGQVNTLGDLATKYTNSGKQGEYFNGVDVNLTARIGNGGFLNAGVSTGQDVTDDCIRPDSPQNLYCHTVLPFSAMTLIKVSGAYPLPWWGVRVSGTLQNLPG